MKLLGSAAHGLAAAAVALLCSCVAVPQGEVRRPVVQGADLGLTGTTVSPALQGWWMGFGDLQLDRLIETSLKDNPRLAQAMARLQLAQAQAEAAHAGRLPDIRLDAGETRLQVPSGFPHPLGGTKIWAADLGGAFSWDLDLSGKQAAVLAQARAQAEAADLDVAGARLLLAGALAQAYIDLYRGYALADIAERAAVQRLNILDITRRRVAAGLDTRVELREAEGALPQARLALAQAQSAQALAVHQLAALSGRGADAYAAIERPRLNLDTVLPLPTLLPINLLQRRPDVIAARWRIEAADAQRRAAKAAFYPHVSLTALVGFASISLSDLIGASSFGYAAGPAVSLPLFDGGRLHAQYHGAAAQLDQAVEGYNDTVLQAVRQAADQLSQIDALRRELEQQRQWSDAAEDAYRLAEERYRAGLASYLTVLNAETEVLNARRQSVDLGVALALARVTLLLAVGGSFQSPDAQLSGDQVSRVAPLVSSVSSIAAP